MEIKSVLMYSSRYLVSIPSILLLVLIPILERKTHNKIKQILKIEEIIENEKTNITWDSIQKIKIQVNDHFQLLNNLGSKQKKYLYEAMTKILLENLNAASKRKANIGEFSKKNHEAIIIEIDKWIKKNIDEINKIIKQKKILENELSSLEKKKFFIYMILVSLQSMGLIFNQLL